MNSPERFLDGTRIAYAAFEPFPNAKGSGTRMLQMVSALAEAGALVRFITLSGRDSDIRLPNTVEHRPIQLLEPNFLRRGEQFRDRLIRELIAFRPHVAHYRGIFEAQAVAAYATLKPVLRVFEVNGLYSVELPYHYVRMCEASNFQQKLRNIEAEALCSAHLVVTQSNTTRAYLVGRVPEIQARCVSIPNGAEPFEVPCASRDPGRVPRLIYVGTLAPWQGVAELLMTIRRVSRVTPVELALAGPVRKGWRRQIDRNLRRLGVADCVELLGPLRRVELVEHICRSDICVAPLRDDTRNARQGCSPIKLFEYMMAGKPVVSTDLPCVREIIIPEVNGLLATSSRPRALAEPLLRILADRSLAQRLGDRARESMLQSGTWHHRREVLRETYRERIVSAL